MINRRVGFWMGIAIFGLCAGCAAKPQQSELLGECKELLIPQQVWEGEEEAFVGNTLLTSTDRDTIFWDRKKIVGVLGVGSQVRVARILKDWSGSDGHFLRIQVEILDGPFRGRIAEVPSIAPYHPSPSWIVDYTMDPNALRFNPEIVKDCE